MSDSFFVVYMKIIVAAVLFVLMVSAAIYATTRRAALVRQYCAAHIAALILGTLADLALIKYMVAHGGGIPLPYVNIVFLTPIIFFVGFSIYLCHRDAMLTAEDVLTPILPIVAWGLFVVFGWQRGMGDYDVIGAWFVSAGCGGVDLSAAYGPPALVKRPRVFKLVGYLVIVAAVYIILPATTR